jgi:hypothetical protein
MSRPHEQDINTSSLLILVFGGTMSASISDPALLARVVSTGSPSFIVAAGLAV